MIFKNKPDSGSKRHFPRLPVGVQVFSALIFSAAIATGAQSVTSQGATHTKDAEPADPHAHHRHMMEAKDYERSTHEYVIPDIALVDSSGEPVSLQSQFDSDQPVMLNFIFTTCTTICPVLSATFYQVQQELGDERAQVQVVSITIDPEHDTPERLRSYAENFKADAQWQFLTGELHDIVAIQKAFDAYRGSKANHLPLTFFRTRGASSWVRIEGLASAADIVGEYRSLNHH